MSTGQSKVESGTNAPRPQHGLSGYGAGCRAREILGCGRRCCGKIKQRVPTINCNRLTPAKTDRPASVRQLYLITADHDHLGGLGSHSMGCGVWSFTISCQRRSSSLSRSRSPSRQAKHRCYVINVCAIEMRFISSPPATAANATRVCLLMCIPCPVPVLCTGAWAAGDSCSRETAGGRLPSCPTSSHATAISKQWTNPRINSQQLV